MDDDDLDLSTVPKTRQAKTGRRAKGGAQFGIGDDDGPGAEDAGTLGASTERPPDRPVKAAVSGWDEDAPRKTRPSRQLGEGFDFEDDLFDIDSTFGETTRERLRPSSPGKSDDSDNDIPVIPELEEQQEEDMTSKVAIAPNVAVNRVATYRELDNDLLRQAAFLNLDNEIDLKLLTKSLSPEADLIEEDRAWDWDRLFTEVMSELTTEWEKQELESGEKTKDAD